MKAGLTALAESIQAFRRSRWGMAVRNWSWFRDYGVSLTSRPADQLFPECLDRRSKLLGSSFVDQEMVSLATLFLERTLDFFARSQPIG
jgi:hypothetical protein